ncbi:hypothetical protein [Halomonas piscis]|uniref:hypothetical protein n=1 Tax=Halomonas piscis TaxID=3031727 RepID=UPI00289A2353|nr:hypothetical protein [Halomonas piscis]
MSLLSRKEVEPLTAYSDIQTAFIRYRDARDAYSNWLENHALSSVRGYEAHLGLDSRRVKLNGKDQRYVQTGDPFHADGFKPSAFEGMSENGSTLQFYMRVALEESEQSHQKSWIALRINCEKQGESVAYMIRADGFADVDPVSVRIPVRLEPPQRTDLYEAISAVIMSALDASPYEMPKD